MDRKARGTGGPTGCDMKEIVGVIFGAGLMANAGLFLIQAVKIHRTKSSRGVSVLTFAGFWFLQVTGILHGIYQRDMYLLAGMIASFLACGSVIATALCYRKK